MRIKWTSIHNVVEANAAAPWVGPGLAERLKREALAERTEKDKKKTRSQRAIAWFRRSR
jgi:hypothetical protein